MRQKQSLKMTQQLVMTPQLQQAIKMLQLNRLEMLETVQQEMLENPVLEEIQDTDSPETFEGLGEQVPEIELGVGDNGGTTSDMDWSAFLENYYNNNEQEEYYRPDQDEESNFESFTSKKATLSEHLLWQLQMSNFNPDERQIASYVIGNIDDDGYMRMPLEEMAKELECEESAVLDTLKKVQNFDPVGVASRDLKECLLTQIEHLGLDETVIETIVKDHFHLIEKKDPKILCKAAKCSEEDALEALKVILMLEPKPGRSFSDEGAQYIIPDIYIHKVGDDYVVVLNEDGLPKLRISGYYRKLMQKQSGANEVTKGYIQDKLRNAVWLIKSINQRQRTIYRVAKSIVKFQRDFLDKGSEHLKPLSLKDVAQDIEMHESTVSRVTNNKYANTPQGIYELKYFFNSCVHTTGGDEISSESVKTKIGQIIAAEDPKKPRSDQDIAKTLKEMGVDIARRTVTKYREALSIQTSSKRRKNY